MIITKKVKVEINEDVIFECDKCKKSIMKEDWVEWQETLSVDMIGGYGSVYGDGVSLKFDLCQNCLYEMVKDFARIE